MIYEDKPPRRRGISFAPPDAIAGPVPDLFSQLMMGINPTIHAPRASAWARWSKPGLPLVVVAALLCLGVANIAARATWREVEDGVLWVLRDEGIVAAEIAANS